MLLVSIIIVIILYEDDSFPPINRNFTSLKCNLSLVNQIKSMNIILYCVEYSEEKAQLYTSMHTPLVHFIPVVYLRIPSIL